MLLKNVKYYQQLTKKLNHKLQSNVIITTVNITLMSEYSSKKATTQTHHRHEVKSLHALQIPQTILG